MATPDYAATLPVVRKYSDSPRSLSRALAPQSERATQKQTPMRRYHLAYLRRDGHPEYTDKVAPASAKFETAFSAFSRGTLISTPRGRIGIEDLVPGMEVLTAEFGPLPVLWVGTMTIIPQARGIDPRSCSLTRVMPEAFGLGRPESNLMAGPGARILARPETLRDNLGGDKVLTPARDLVDGINVIDVMPQRPVAVYHFALDRHAVIKANGIDMETFHPGHGFERNVGPNALSLFMSLFPHMSRLSEFGSTRHMRLPFDNA